MNAFRKFIVSCDLFGGFTCRINVNTCESLDDIVRQVVSRLESVLERNNLLTLLSSLEDKKQGFHIHDKLFGQILLEDVEYYVCNHGCGSSTSPQSSNNPEPSSPDSLSVPVPVISTSRPSPGSVPADTTSSVVPVSSEEATK